MSEHAHSEHLGLSEYKKIGASSSDGGWIKSKAGGVLAAVLVLLWIAGLGLILAGVILGTMLVMALLMTIERIPGFWPLATTGVGKVIVVVGTAYLAHIVFGSSTLTGLVALGWSLVLKILIVDAVTRQRKLGA